MSRQNRVLALINKGKLVTIAQVFGHKGWSVLSKDDIVQRLSTDKSIELDALLDLLSKSDLERICAKLDLKASGSKKVLIGRIVGNEMVAPPSSTVTPAFEVARRTAPKQPEIGKLIDDAMVPLNRAAGIAIHLEEARNMRDELAYFQAIQRNLKKYTVGGSRKSDEELGEAIKQIISSAVTSDEVVDVFQAAGFKRPDISILSDEFLETLQKNPHRNLQLELLKKLLNDEIRSMKGRNVVQSRRFSEMLERTLLAYQNRTLEAAEVIMELIRMAKEVRDSAKRGNKLGLTDDELGFYDALCAHGNVKNLMGDKVLADIAHDLVAAIRASVTIDWTQKESVRAKMRTKVKRLLRKHGYPPDKRNDATKTVIEQAEQVCKDWAEAA